MFFTAIFTIELAINFYAHKYGHFINSWNIFDSVVVFVSLLPSFSTIFRASPPYVSCVPSASSDSSSVSPRFEDHGGAR